jgi:SAM-dependent methyltransferase
MDKFDMSWSQFWDERQVLQDKDVSLIDYLINLNGFDSKPNFISPQNWYKLCEEIIEMSKVDKLTRIFEIGCGSGILLKTINDLTGCEVFGVEPSKALFSVARQHLPESEIWNKEALHISDIMDKFDVIIMHSVVQYFPNLEYLSNVIKKTRQILAENGILICLDLPDLSLKKSYLEDSIIKNLPKSRKILPEHLFIHKEDFKNILTDSGYANITYFRYPVDEYYNSRFRFNVMAQGN